MRYGSSDATGKRLLAAAFLASLGATLAFRILWVGPQRDLLAMRQAELEQAGGQAARARREAGRLPGLEAEVERLQRRWEVLGPTLPGPREAAVLLRGLQEIAARSGLRLETFTLAEVHPREQFEEWPVRLELTGGFHDLTTFLDEVSRLRRLVTVSRMSIRARPAGARAATIAVTCTAATYVRRGAVSHAGATE